MPTAPSAPQASAPTAAPLDLCKASPEPPPDLAKTPGYRQLFVRVTDASGHPIAGLSKGDFVVSQNGRTIPIGFFNDSAGKAPVSLVIVLDASGSMFSKFVVIDKDKRTTVRGSLDGVVGRLDQCDEIAALAFGASDEDKALQKYQALRYTYAPQFSHKVLATTSQVRMVQAFTTSGELPLTKLEAQLAGGETPLYDAVHYALQTVGKRDYPNGAILVISDGIDTISTRSKLDEIAEARGSGVPIYSVAVGVPDSKIDRDLRKYSDYPADATKLVGPMEYQTLGKRISISDETGRKFGFADADTLRAFSDATGGATLQASAIAMDEGRSFVTAQSEIASMLGQVYTIGIVAPDLPADQLPSLTISGKPGAIVHILPNTRS
ncbi:MAG TPA: hypothetical protein VEF03_05330 [Candidatus Binataceae bacterium]|nr:hypothetical protein [Candidatus Binataceae bacterium]